MWRKTKIKILVKTVMIEIKYSKIHGQDGTSSKALYAKAGI